MSPTETIIPSTKLKIKLSAKRIEVDSMTKYEPSERISLADKNGCFNEKEKYTMWGSVKRGPQGSIEGQKEKRQKIDRKASVHCATILRSLISHKYSWVFNKPVDPVALNIPDYFTVISQPMDLGTIKSKLEKNTYFRIDEFAADVRLTFSNAMTYNPPSNDVHLMAKELKRIFERKWKDLEKKLKWEDEHGKSMTETVRETEKKISNGTHLLRKGDLSKKLQVPALKGIQKIGSLPGRHAEVEALKSSQIPCKVIGKDLNKGKGNGGRTHSPCGPIKVSSSVGLATCRCSKCGDSICHCIFDSNARRVTSDMSSEGSEGRDPYVRGANALRPGCRAHCKSPSLRKNDIDSDGTVSGLDSEHACSSPELTTHATDACSGEVRSTSVFDVQLSPKKALRAAMLKSRFADTILKAQQQTLLNHGDKSDPRKIQLEKERLERIQREERARLEAQIKAAEAAAKMKAEKEFKQRREQEREAARIAIEKVERTVEIENNLEILKELEMLSGCKLTFQALARRDDPRSAMGIRVQHPLQRFGLFIKDEFIGADENEILNNWEEGEIFY